LIDANTVNRSHYPCAKRATEANQRLKRLYDATESGVADLGDADLKDRIATLKATRDQARTDADRANALLNSATNRSIPSDMPETFAQTGRQRMLLDGGGYRRDHLRALAERIGVAKGEVRIMGSKGALLQTSPLSAEMPEQGPKGAWCPFLFRTGGAGGIRTHDGLLTHTHFPGERLRPLGHRSACSGMRGPSRGGARWQVG
jgi:site-specific DNA recombinase